MVEVSIITVNIDRTVKLGPVMTQLVQRIDQTNKKRYRRRAICGQLPSVSCVEAKLGLTMSSEPPALDPSPVSKYDARLLWRFLTLTFDFFP